MRVIILKSEAEVATFAANTIAQIINQKNKAVLGLATGQTPMLTYQNLIEKYQQKQISFKEVVSFNLDEYIGLTPNHLQSYRYFMDEQLFKYIDIQSKNTHLPNCPDKQYQLFCQQYEQMIERVGGIDIQLLGLGANGHIGFNEPTSSLNSLTRVKTLTQKTIADNARFFDSNETQPELSITMGIKTILNSKQVLLLATGENKSGAIASVIEGPISSLCPGSALQLHQNVTIVIDESAAVKLKLRDYYLHVESIRQQQNL